MEGFTLIHAKQLYYRFCAIYGEKFLKSFHDDDFRTVWYEEWRSGLRGIDPTVIASVLEHCKENLEWTPSIAEFRRLCESASGMPSAEDCLRGAIRGDFSHPITAMAYERVGSWAMKNSKESELHPKFKTAYQESLAIFRQNPEEAPAKLEVFLKNRALPAPPSKIPSKAELISFKERYRQWQAQAQIEKEKRAAEGVVHPTWEKAQITRGAKAYDEKVYMERKRYLLSIDELVAITLPTEDLYDRCRYLREIEALNYVARVQSGAPHGKDAG